MCIFFSRLAQYQNKIKLFVHLSPPSALTALSSPTTVSAFLSMGAEGDDDDDEDKGGEVSASSGSFQVVACLPFRRPDAIVGRWRDS